MFGEVVKDIKSKTVLRRRRILSTTFKQSKATTTHLTEQLKTPSVITPTIFNMKSFIVTSLFTILPALLVSATPTPQGDTSPNFDLLKRAACTVEVDLDFDKHGTCVDTTKARSCPNGILVPGHCGGGNNIICCIPNDCFRPETKK